MRPSLKDRRRLLPPSVKLQLMETKDMQKGDLIYDPDYLGDYGIVTKKGKTILHSHRFTKVKWLNTKSGELTTFSIIFLDERRKRFNVLRFRK